VNNREAGIVERVAGHPATLAAATGAGLVVASPLAVFLPPLASCLAAERQRTRLERFYQELEAELAELREQLKDLTDTQYQLISEAATSALHTLDQRKLDYLRYAIRNALYVKVDPAQSAAVARAVRDISAEEADFLLRASDYEDVAMAGSSSSKTLVIDRDSDDAVALDGLLSLGLLRAETGYGAGGASITKNARIVVSLLKSA
jgi:sensor c-di-GMP phosphodiesterase-like protein